MLRRRSERLLSTIGVFEQDLPLDCIRHSDRVCYVNEGHGGREIEVWPIYRFFLAYAGGEPDRARVEFTRWYHEQFMKYRHVSKRLGGMCGGSLARAMESVTSDGPKDGCTEEDEANEDLHSNLREAIALRVKQRFGLVDSIRKFGYIPDCADPVIGIRKGGRVYLEGGHHRAAALKALGWSVLPAALVFSGPGRYRVWQWCRAIRHAAAARGLVDGHRNTRTNNEWAGTDNDRLL